MSNYLEYCKAVHHNILIPSIGQEEQAVTPCSRLLRKVIQQFFCKEQEVETTTTLKQHQRANYDTLTLKAYPSNMKFDRANQKTSNKYIPTVFRLLTHLTKCFHTNNYLTWCPFI